MEEYNKIYPELAKEAPKDDNAFRLQQSCRVLDNLEKEAKHYTSVKKTASKKRRMQPNYAERFMRKYSKN